MNKGNKYDAIITEVGGTVGDIEGQPFYEAIRQMIEISSAPVIASHSSARSLCNHSRNLDDEQLDWIKKNGGVVQTVALAGFLRDDISTELVSVKDLVDHIDYMVERIGIDHVGISSDFDGGGGIQGWSDASETFNVTKELLKRGYTKEEISKIWSGNLLRVLTEVTEIANNIQTNSISTIPEAKRKELEEL